MAAFRLIKRNGPYANIGDMMRMRDTLRCGNRLLKSRILEKRDWNV